MKILSKYRFLLLVAFIGLLTSCNKDEKIGFLSPNIKYTTASINVSVGTTLVRSGAMVIDESTKPLEFSIAAIKKEDGSIATAVSNYKVDTYFWHAAYTGKELDNEELDAKREKVNRPAVDINSANGQIIIYPEANDTTVLSKGKYIIDIKVKNSSGEKIIENALTLNVSYAAPSYFRLLGVDGNLKDVKCVITRKEETGNKITVRVLDKNDKPVDPASLIGYDYGTNGVVDLKDWHNLGLKNPTKYTAFPDRLELEVAGFPLPFVAGQYLTIDMYNNGSVNGSYFNYWFYIAIYKPGVWDVELKLLY